ncbi:SH3 domain-containing protein [Demequina sp. SYSU T00192]|uniref:SH3 domain-containing protein n=1 Tax=Demequina litoralis TaxID=3051660 RepID=A0ABT8G619_9MICO|nr:SH3 domain-containing protein [Demequina sp. SYSU T00192]MDN4474507.1 SH3 domain-containing protein [Demequina sp. SYSU T00192]
MTITRNRTAVRATGIVAAIVAAAVVSATPATAASSAATASSIDTSVSAVTPIRTEISVGQNLWVTGTALKLRNGPSNSNRVKMVAYKGAKVKATGKTEGRWVQIKAGGTTAWAPSKFFTSDKPKWDAVPVGTLGANLQLRSGPSNSYAVKTTAAFGTMGRFTRIERNGWWQVRINGTYAWTPERFLSVGGVFDTARILDIAHSQVGYREPSWRNNRYNDWIDGNYAWCHVFVEWVFDRADYANGVPYKKHFDAYVTALRKSGVLDTTPTAGEIKKGDVVLVDWYPYRGPTHTGIVDHVSGDSIYLVEGNTTSGTGETGRGVFYRKRAMVDIHASYRPSDFAKWRELKVS